MGGRAVQKLTVALAGNPNVGKSTLFNALTGLHRHTGNWSGKTVDLASGRLRQGDTLFEFVDLPGTYSLVGTAEERLAADYIRSGEADCVVVVCDAGALERNLILALQIIRMGAKVVLCVNLMDEARRQGITVDGEKLSRLLSVPVVLTTASRRQGIGQLLQSIRLAAGQPPALYPPAWAEPIAQAGIIAAACVQDTGAGQSFRIQLDRILLSRRRGIPILLTLLFLLVWLTVFGANYPSAWLQSLFDGGYDYLEFVAQSWPGWLSGLLLDGVYVTVARVLAVMLPPMAIFFVLFTVLEDVGYLPRMAFLLDGTLRRCGGCGKQALTLCMGLGCNAVGITGCRIIDSPRERLLAILTNAMVPCNGRFPTLILLAGLFCGSSQAALLVAGMVVLGVLGAMASSGVLSKTVLRHTPSVFIMELPPLRRPHLGHILTFSLWDRTLRIALRAVSVAAPAGALLWLMQQFDLVGRAADFLNPLGLLLGMNGAMLLGFLLSMPANELMIPITVMALTGVGLQSATDSAAVLLSAGITWQNALCAMVFTVFHWPCCTTMLTIHRETGSLRKTLAAFLLPTAVGAALCMLLPFILSFL